MPVGGRRRKGELVNAPGPGSRTPDRARKEGMYMVFLASVVLHAMLVMAPGHAGIAFRVTKAQVSYEAKETNLGSSLKKVVGRNRDLSITLHASPGSVRAELAVSSAGFKTDRPMRDWSVRNLYLKSGTYPEITFALLKIDGEDLSSVLRPVDKDIVLRAAPEDMTVVLLVPGSENAPLVLRTGGGDIAITGRLRNDILKIMAAGRGEIPVTGRLTVAGGSKVFDTTVSINRTGDRTFDLSTVIHAGFSDFGMSAPTMYWFIAVHDALTLKGDCVIEIVP